MDKNTSKAKNMMGIKEATLSEVEYTFSQDTDSCQSEDIGQTIKIFTADGGGGAYIVFSTPRWAIDADDIDQFAACLKKIVKIPEE